MDPLDDYPDAIPFKFGDGPELCERLIEAVRSGKKRATCGALIEYQEEEEPIPEVGSQELALHWDGTPALIFENEAVDLVPFSDVTEEFALAEGENDSLEGWRQGHREFFERTCGFDPDMILVCQRFRVIKDFDAEE